MDLDVDIDQVVQLLTAYEAAAVDAVRYAFSVRALAIYIIVMIAAGLLRLLAPRAVSLAARALAWAGIYVYIVTRPEYELAFRDSAEIGYALVFGITFWMCWIPPILLSPILRLYGIGQPGFGAAEDEAPPVAAGQAPVAAAVAAAAAAAGGNASNIYASGVASQGKGNVEQRQVTTIMLTDIVGYSKMMEKDEKATYELLKKHNEIMRKQIAAHRGREIKTMGDAFMVTYESPMDAVKCGIAMQRALANYNKDRLLHEQIKIRIGVHCGEATVTKNDVFGEAVNIAARLEPLTTPGGMSISSDVYQHVKNKIEAGFQSIGVQPMKNIANPPEVYRVSFSTD